MRTRFKTSQAHSIYVGRDSNYRKDVNGQWYLYTYTDYHFDPRVYGRLYETWTVCRDVVHKGPPYKTGGPLDLCHIDQGDFFNRQYLYGKAFFGNLNSYNEYVGGMIPTVYPGNPYNAKSSWATTYASSDRLRTILGDGSSRGQEGYDKFTPVKPSVELGQTLAEVAELPRMLITSAKNFLRLWKVATFKRKHTRYSMRLQPKHVADEWLNNQFGWVPFLNTVRDFYTTSRDLSKRLQRLREYNGKWERRGGLLFNNPGKPELYKSGVAGISPNLSSGFGPIANRPYTITITKSEKTWFSALYKYYIPELDTCEYPPGVIKHLYGLDITPSLLWQIMPWTWLTDWAYDVTSLLKAHENPFGECVSKNAYVMSTLHHDFTFETDVKLIGGGGSGSWAYTTLRKTRKGATHYGFDVPYSGLSPWRLSILASLGLSKSKARWQAGL